MADQRFTAPVRTV